MGNPALLYEIYDDNILLGVLTRIELLDWPWFSADFHPTPDYALYRARLEAKYRSDDEEESPDDIEIEPLVLTLIDPHHGKSGSALLYDEGDWVRFRVSFD
jgi:hypothetical protein